MKRAVSFSLVLVAACSPGDETPEDCHWIGTLNPLTGDLGTVGLPLENAARLAVRDVNEAGTVAGKRLCVATGDTRTNPTRASAIVDALVEQNGILALNGAAASASTIEAAKAAARYDMAVVSCCSTSPALSGDPNVQRTVPSDALQGVALAELAKERAPASLAVIYIDDPYGDLLREQFLTAFTALSPSTIVRAAVPYESARDSYADVVQEAFADNPELVVLIAFPIAGAEIIKAWRESRLSQSSQWLATDGLKDSRFVLLTGDGIPRIEGTAPTQQGPRFAGFAQRYRAAFGGEEPGIFTPNQYDAVVLIALALAAAGPDRAAIRAEVSNVSRDGTPVHADELGTALRLAESGADIDYVGVSGEVDLDANGDVVSGYQLWGIAESGSEVFEEDRCYECVASSTVAAGVRCDPAPCRAAVP